MLEYDRIDISEGIDIKIILISIFYIDIDILLFLR